MLDTYHLSFAITGANGSAASPTPSAANGNKTSRPLAGMVCSVYVKYNTQPSTADVVVRTSGENGPSQTFLTLTNKNTDALFYPRVAVHDVLGAAALYAAGGTAIVDCPVIDDYVEVTVAQGNAGTIDVWLVVER